MDQYTMSKLGEMRIDELRREALLHQQTAGIRPPAPIASVRRAAGSMMVRAGSRLMGARTTVTIEVCEGC